MFCTKTSRDKETCVTTYPKYVCNNQLWQTLWSTAVWSVSHWVRATLTCMWFVVLASSLCCAAQSALQKVLQWVQWAVNRTAWLSHKSKCDSPLLFALDKYFYPLQRVFFKEETRATHHMPVNSLSRFPSCKPKFFYSYQAWQFVSNLKSTCVIFLSNIFNILVIRHQYKERLRIFFTLPGTRIQEWQRTACTDMHYKRAAGHIQCARSCKTAGAQPVPSAPPSLKGISTYGNIKTQVSHIIHSSMLRKIWEIWTKSDLIIYNISILTKYI